MHYYEVRVAGRSYHSKKPLTYHHETPVNEGTVVTVPVRGKKLNGFIIREVGKPSFTTKSIARVAQTPALSSAAMELHQWMEKYYPATSSATLQLFLPKTILKKSKAASDTIPQIAQTTPDIPPLRPQQKKITDQIMQSKIKSFLLHGETGSGKTRVYAELAKRVISHDKKSVLILTPEIGLTAQLVIQLELLLQKDIVVLHSQLTEKQKRERWEKIANTQEPLVIVGARSALFAPFHSLGLIVIDEAHEDAYKQEQAPHYHATRVGAQLAALHKARLVLGSATPSVADYAVFSSKGLPILAMSNEAKDFSFDLVDIKDRSQFSDSQYMSKKLVTRVHEALSNGEQSLIFLNRRGSARLVLCQNCGWESTCPRCDIALTFHDDSHRMQCHTCGLSESPPATCPNCKSPDIFYKQIGTKALVSHVKKVFPEARVARFDTDVQKSDRLEARYKEVQSGEIDILVGTQLLGKGLDLPNLSTVGVLQADSSLVLPDFSAREKTYQQLHQIIGRVARGHRSGHVVIQTYNPESPLLTAAIKKDYSVFLRQELDERKKFIYPPYCYLLQITCSRKQNLTAEQAATQVADVIKGLSIKAQLIGPSPAFKQKTHGNYHWQIIVKSKERDNLLQIIDVLPKNVSYNIDPVNLL